MIFEKMRRLSKKVFSSKTYLLVGLNKTVPNELGKIIDIEVDRERKNIYLELEKSQEIGYLDILAYGITYEGNRAFLTYRFIEKRGYLRTSLKDLSINDRLLINPLYIKIVEKIL